MGSARALQEVFDMMMIAAAAMPYIAFKPDTAMTAVLADDEFDAQMLLH